MTPTLSIVTGTVNRPDSLQRLIRSIQTLSKAPWELLIADASDEPVVTDDARIRVLPERPPLGYTRGYNRAFREASGQWVLFVNDDAEVRCGYDTEAIAFMEAHPHIGLGALYYSNRGGRMMVNTHWHMVYANFGIIERELGNQLGWFDEEFRMYGSDNSLAFRVLLAGRGIAGIPNAQITHHEVHDPLREANQGDRFPEADRLRDKYWRYHPEMYRTYLRYVVT